MLKTASNTEMELLGQTERVSDWKKQEREPTCDVKQGEISSFMKEYQLWTYIQ